MSYKKLTFAIVIVLVVLMCACAAGSAIYGAGKNAAQVATVEPTATQWPTQTPYPTQTAYPTQVPYTQAPVMKNCTLTATLYAMPEYPVHIKVTAEYAELFCGMMLNTTLEGGSIAPGVVPDGSLPVCTVSKNDAIFEVYSPMPAMAESMCQGLRSDG